MIDLAVLAAGIGSLAVLPGWIGTVLVAAWAVSRHAATNPKGVALWCAAWLSGIGAIGCAATTFVPIYDYIGHELPLPTVLVVAVSTVVSTWPTDTHSLVGRVLVGGAVLVIGAASSQLVARDPRPTSWFRVDRGWLVLAVFAVIGGALGALLYPLNELTERF